MTRIRSVEKRAIDYLARNPARSGSTWITFLGLLNRARHDLAVTKARATADFVGDCVEAGQKVVVFTAYNGAVDLFRERFAGRCVSLTGSDSAEARQDAVDTFQRDDSVRVFIGNLHAAGVGITLTAATHVVFNDLDWVPANHWQAEDRIHRIGQTKGTLATYLYAPGTLDDFVASLLEQKAQIIAELEDGAGAAASLIEQVVDRALDGDDPADIHEPATAPRPTVGLLEETLELLARLARRPTLPAHRQSRVHLPQLPRPERRLHHGGVQRRGHLRLPRLHLRRQLQTRPRSGAPRCLNTSPDRGRYLRQTTMSFSAATHARWTAT